MSHPFTVLLDKAAEVSPFCNHMQVFLRGDPLPVTPPHRLSPSLVSQLLPSIPHLPAFSFTR